jgi:hypothetical protein
MADEAYERQHLVLQAAGFISADGSTATAFGCSMTRVATGVYAMVLPDDAGVVAAESFMAVMPKGPLIVYAAGAVQDTSPTVKTVSIFDFAGSLANADVEIILRKTVTK